jgi:MATE family multidrug resistance protein
MKRSWILLNVTTSVLSLVYIFAPPILKIFGQSDEISTLVGKFTICMLPRLFAYAMNFPNKGSSNHKARSWPWIRSLQWI